VIANRMTRPLSESPFALDHVVVVQLQVSGRLRPH
jgi:hypothetical protein